MSQVSRAKEAPGKKNGGGLEIALTVQLTQNDLQSSPLLQRTASCMVYRVCFCFGGIFGSRARSVNCEALEHIKSGEKKHSTRGRKKQLA
jgi:hypothetical protein